MNHLAKIAAMVRRWEALHDAADMAMLEVAHVFMEDSVSFWTGRYDSAINRANAVKYSTDALISIMAIEAFADRQAAARAL